MIDPPGRHRRVRPSLGHGRGRGRGRLGWPVLVGVLLATSAGGLIGRSLHARVAVHPVAQPSALVPAPSVEVAAVPTVSVVPSATAAVTDVAASLLQMSGRVPTHGSGKFRYATSRGPVLGESGRLRRFRVAAERGSGENVNAFADVVAAVLGDPRSWIGGGSLRLQLVAGDEPADFTVFLATRTTAGAMCARGGVAIRINGVPYTSCRAVGKVIINLDRWQLSARPYRSAEVPLATYRQYVINHEVGHELGHHHQGCPRAGGPAPVMVQQTLTTRGCKPYAWPRRGSHFLTGSAL